MQAEVSVKDMQTSPREILKEELTTTTASDIVPQVADKMVLDIVQNMPFKVPTNTQETVTETTEFTEKITQTNPQSETTPHQEEMPYEIHIQTSFVVPEELGHSSANPTTSKQIIELTKSFVIGESEPDVVREIETTSKVKTKKSKNKKKKKSEDLPKPSTDIEESKVSKETFATEQHVPVEAVQEPEQKPTFVTLNITKTTVYETSNIIGKERVSLDPCLTIDESLPEETISQGIYYE